MIGWLADCCGLPCAVLCYSQSLTVFANSDSFDELTFAVSWNFIASN
jgi:hypothetical protein